MSAEDIKSFLSGCLFRLAALTAQALILTVENEPPTLETIADTRSCDYSGFSPEFNAVRAAPRSCIDHGMLTT